jgi:hypothetical protein
LGKIYEDARKIMNRSHGSDIKHGNLALIRLKLEEAGQSLFKEPDFNASIASLCPSGTAPAPLVGDSECDVFSFGSSPLDEGDVEFLSECQRKYREVLRLALRAARGLEFEFNDYIY